MSEIIATEEGIGQLLETGISLPALRAGMRVNAASLIEPPVHVAKQIRWELPIRVGAFSMLHGPGDLVASDIGRYCSVAPGVTIGSNEHAIDWLSSSSLLENPELYGWPEKLGLDKTRFLPRLNFQGSVARTIIGNDVWIGHSAFIRGGVRVGDGAVIGAKSVVLQDVPAYAIVAGNPARLIRYRFDHEHIVKLVASRWWTYSIYDLLDFDLKNPMSMVGAIENANLKPYEPRWRDLTGIAREHPRSTQDLA